MQILSHYFDLKAIPQQDRTQPQVVSDLMQVLHRHLPHYNNQDQRQIAVSFPTYGRGRTLGGIIRLHGKENDLVELHDQLASVSGYALICPIQKIPEKINGFASFVRKQYKGASTARRLKARYEKRNDQQWTSELAQAVTKKYSQQKYAPFVKIKSASTGQTMPLHIQKVNATAEVKGQFNGYGLSKNIQGKSLATIPLF